MHTIVQFTDTHVGAPGKLHFGHASARYLRDAIAAVALLPVTPLCALVTGDLVDFGTRAEYENFVAVADTLEIP